MNKWIKDLYYVSLIHKRTISDLYVWCWNVYFKTFGASSLKIKIKDSISVQNFINQLRKNNGKAE